MHTLKALNALKCALRCPHSSPSQHPQRSLKCALKCAPQHALNALSMRLQRAPKCAVNAPSTGSSAHPHPQRTLTLKCAPSKPSIPTQRPQCSLKHALKCAPSTPFKCTSNASRPVLAILGTQHDIRPPPPFAPHHGTPPLCPSCPLSCASHVILGCCHLLGIVMRCVCLCLERGVKALMLHALAFGSLGEGTCVWDKGEGACK